MKSPSFNNVTWSSVLIILNRSASSPMMKLSFFGFAKVATFDLKIILYVTTVKLVRTNKWMIQ